VKHLGILTAILAGGIAACSAGSPVGGTSGPGASGGSTASGGKGGSVGSGGSSAKGSGGSGSAMSGGTSQGGSNATGGSGNTSGTSGSAGSSGAVGQVLDCPNGPALGSPVLRLLTRREFENSINDVFPSAMGQWSDSLPANVVTAYGFDNDAGAVVGNQLASSLLDTSLAIATAVTGSGLTNILSCAGSSANHACAKTFLDQYGQKLFRRPMTDAEEQRYLTLFDTGLAASDFKTALKWVIAGLIQSPNTVYRSEIGAVAGNVRKLSNYELATELAYTFTGSTPSDSLLQQAASNLDPVATAKQLMQTPAGQEMIQQFLSAYIAYDNTSAVVRTLADPAAQQGDDFPDVAADMVNETRAFISDVVINKGGSLSDLLTANTTNPSAKLAQYYGANAAFPMPSSDYASVTRPAGEGVGILAQGSFLATHANGGYSSPTRRGLFVYYNLLCQSKLTPPTNVPPITDTDTQAAHTTRELYETTHLAAGNSQCKACHQYFDPIGFGFENFDQGGRYRTAQNNGQYPVDPSGNVLAPDGSQMFTFKNEEDLMNQLAKLPESAQCFSAYMATYAFGSAASCLGPSSAQGLQDGSVGIVDAYAALASEPNFTQRNTQ
jgi:hypothetical protein